MSVLNAGQFGAYDPIAEGRASISAARGYRQMSKDDPDPQMRKVWASQVPMQLKAAATHRRNAQKGTTTSFGNDPANLPPSRSSRPRGAR